jgi:hypothetical protein
MKLFLLIVMLTSFSLTADAHFGKVNRHLADAEKREMLFKSKNYQDLAKDDSAVLIKKKINNKQ